mmetsp:Transcript_2573/g.2447  ORF Transcript_2573/g.2447 Transcript_2573/m.2447 type:complete len:80 (+) Transcript_2573:320-559(+)
MMKRACTTGEGEESETDGGTVIERLQVLLEACETSKSFIIDAVITTISDECGWSNERFSIHATRGKAATNTILEEVGEP